MIWLVAVPLVLNVVYAFRLLRLEDERDDLVTHRDELQAYLFAACDDADDVRAALRNARLEAESSLIVARAMGTAVCHALAGDNAAAWALVTEYTNREGDAS